MSQKSNTAGLIAFWDTKAKAFYSNWNPDARCVRYYRPNERTDGCTIKLFPAFSEPVIRITYNLGENWEAVHIDYSVFSNLLKKQGITK